jgi:hypothetical protein
MKEEYISLSVISLNVCDRGADSIKQQLQLVTKLIADGTKSRFPLTITGYRSQHLSVAVLGGFGCYVSCSNAVSSRVIHLVFHRLQHNCFSSLDVINIVY